MNDNKKVWIWMICFVLFVALTTIFIMEGLVLPKERVCEKNGFDYVFNPDYAIPLATKIDGIKYIKCCKKTIGEDDFVEKCKVIRYE